MSWERVARELRAGRLALVPTDTVYGLAAAAEVPGATAALFDVKERPIDVSLPVLAGSPSQAFAVCASVPDPARRLAQRFWPGPLTLVLPRRANLVLDLGGADESTIGVRIPAHDDLRALLLEIGLIAATSANRHGQPTKPTLPEVLEQLGPLASRVALTIDGGACAGAPSTVVACRGGGEVEVLRVGRLAEETIHDALS
jgi:L-threonylcarbamoyladenylate synthase